MNPERQLAKALEDLTAARNQAMTPKYLEESMEQRLRHLEPNLLRFERTGWPEDELVHHVRFIHVPFTHVWQRLVLLGEARGLLTVPDSLCSLPNTVWLQQNTNRRGIGELLEAWTAYQWASARQRMWQRDQLEALMTNR